jgi:4-hydroxy-tetrahydrodipicolinate synthase
MPGILEGVIPIVATPFDDRGRVDVGGLRRVVDFLIGAGVQGIAALGVAGEIYALTDDERRAVARTVVAHAAGRVPVVVGASHNSGEAAAVLALEAADAGADVLMVMPPYFIKPTPDAVEAYYAMIAGAAKIPIMIQDNPGWTGVTLSIDLMVRLAQIPEVRYAKVETPAPAAKISALGRAAGGRLVLLGGLGGNWFVEELARGARGTMPAAIMPQVYVAVWSLWQAGAHAEARSLFHRYHGLIRLTNQPGFGLAMVKHVLWQAGVIDTPRVRNPLPLLDAQDREDLERVVAELEVLAVMQGRRVP